VIAAARATAAKLPAWLWALICGALAALAHPPFGFLPGLLAYGGLVLLGDSAPSWKAALCRGWFAGLAYFAIGCWWVAEAFLVDAATFGWMAPIAVILLAGGLALFWGLALVLYRALAREGVSRVLVFAGALALIEWVRGHVFTGFAWNLPGTSWPAGGAASQTAAIVGAYGLTWLTLAICAAPALLVRGDRRKAIIATAFAGLVLAGMAGWGLVALRMPAPASDLLVRIVQPNIPQAAKYDEAMFEGLVATYTGLTRRPAAREPDIVVWPEGALPLSLDEYLAPDSPVRFQIAAALAPGQTLLVGGWRADGPLDRRRYFNTLAAVRREADGLSIAGVYDKYRLVPFGEFLPAEPLLDRLGIKKLVPLESFTPGPKPSPLDIGGVIIQPLICYEALFPGLTSAGARRSGTRAEAIVNISNDAWFGATSGPLQHLNQAAYRAIEEGLPMIRATPTGVSAMIDPQGRKIASLSHGRRGVIDAQLPRAAKPTPYTRTGGATFWLFLVLSAICVRLKR